MRKTLALALALVNDGRARAAGCMLAIMLTFALFGLTSAVDAAFRSGVRGADDRVLIVAHRNSRQLSLPAAYAVRIAALPGVSAVSGRQWFGGWHADPGNAFAQYLVEPVRDLAVHRNVLSPAAQAAFAQRGDSVVVGRTLAERFGWHEGQQVRLTSTTWPAPDGNDDWDFVLAGVFEPDPDGSGATDANVMLINRRAFDERIAYATNLVGWFVVRLRPEADSAPVIAAIDALFAQEASPTVTSTERVYAAHMLRQLGDVGAIATNVSFAIFAALFLATLLYFLQSIMGNMARIAILRALGFEFRRLVVLVGCGTLSMCVSAAALGMALAAIGVRVLAPKLAGVIPGMTLTLGAFGLAAVICLALAGSATALSAWRLRGFNIADLRRAA